MRFDWTTDRDNRLIEMRRDGKTFSEIADRLGCTKSSAISRARRLPVEAIQRPARPAKAASSNATQPWTVEEEAKALDMWTKGMSASEIGVALNRTRSAVISRLYRSGTNKRGRPTKPETVRTAPRPGPQNKPGAVFGKVSVLSPEATEAKRQEQRTQGRSAEAIFQAPANDDAIPLLNRRRFECAWPVGVPDRPANQMCCGQRVPDGASTSVESYCLEHAAMAMSRDASQPQPSTKSFERSVRRWAA